MTGSAMYLLLAAATLAACQGVYGIPCEQFFSVGGYCAFFSCSTTDQAVICLYRNVSMGLWELPKWYLNDETVTPHSIAKYNDTVWRMVYDYSGLSPGEYVFHGKIGGMPGEVLQSCCGLPPQVFLNLTVEAEMRETGEQERVPESVVLQLGKSMKDLVLAIVKVVDEGTGDDQKH